MVAISLLILALAAGTYLLIKVTREYLGTLFKGLAWLVIVLSLASIAFMGVKKVHRYYTRHNGGGYKNHEMMMKHGGGHCCSGGGQGCTAAAEKQCCSGGGGAVGGCKMEGDSIVWDKAACEKAMGKEACDKMSAERGRCIMSKEECRELCATGAKCGYGEKSGCCASGSSGGEARGCCKKKM